MPKDSATQFKKGAWTAEEDELLKRLILEYGAKNWSLIAGGIKGRSGKSCRLRWCNQLNPEVKRTAFSEWEDAVIICCHKVCMHQHGAKQHCPVLLASYAFICHAATCNVLYACNGVCTLSASTGKDFVDTSLQLIMPWCNCHAGCILQWLLMPIKRGNMPCLY